ncbi:MAG: hypothetical protein AAFZ89_09870 [Bacteroidota bacterium]
MRKKKINWLQKAREGWDNTGNTRPPFAIEPKEGQRSVWDFPRPPSIEKVSKSIMVKYQGKRSLDFHMKKEKLGSRSPFKGFQERTYKTT